MLRNTVGVVQGITSQTMNQLTDAVYWLPERLDSRHCLSALLIDHRVSEVSDPPCLYSGSSLRVDGSRRSALLIFWELVTRGWKSPIRPAYILGAGYAWMEVSDPPCLYSGSSLRVDGSLRSALLIFWELVRRGWKSPIRPAYRLGARYAWMEVADPPCLYSGSSLGVDGSLRSALLIVWELVTRGWKSPIRPAYILGARYAWMEVSDPPCLYSGSSLGVDGSLRSALLICWELVTRGWKSPTRPAYILGAR